MAGAREDVKARIDAIEESYEFFLAYAAQGLTSDQGSKSGTQLRGFLDAMTAALDGLSGRVRAAVSEDALEPSTAWDNMCGVLERDVASAGAAVRLVAGQSAVSSQLIDNLNANIHLRAVLTDLFLVDELIG